MRNCMARGKRVIFVPALFVLYHRGEALHSSEAEGRAGVRRERVRVKDLDKIFFLF